MRVTLLTVMASLTLAGCSSAVAPSGSPGAPSSATGPSLPPAATAPSPAESSPSPAESTPSQPTPTAPDGSPASPASPTSSASPEPAAFGPDTISTDEEEYRVSFAPDGQTAYFARGAAFFPLSQKATSMESRLVDGQWAEATVASFSGTYPDIDPWLSPDGERLYFSSIRPVDGQTRADADLWMVERDGDDWGEPVHLPNVNTESEELGASITADGVLWFASDRPGGAGGWDIYTARPDGDGFAAPEPVDAINQGIWEFNPAISADGNLLVFTSIGRVGGRGLGDLFFTTLTEGEWSDPEPLAINTPADEYHASFSPDGRGLYFVRRIADGDLYEVPWPNP